MKFLIIRLKAVGDTILTTPVFRNIKKYFHNSIIDVIVYPNSYDILKNNPYIDKVIILKIKNISKFIFYLKSIFKKYDVIIDYINNPTSTLIAFFTRSRFKIGIKNKRNFFYTHRLKISGNIYTGIKNLKYLEPLGINDFSDFMPEIFLNNSEIKKGKRILMEIGIPLKNIVGIFASAKYETRRYPPENFAELAKIIAKKTKYNVLFLFGYNDFKIYEIIRSICKDLKNIYFSPLNLNLLEISAIIKNLKFFITSDTGPKHIGVALKIPTLTIFSSTNPLVWNPPDTKRFPFIRNEIDCIGCESNSCESLKCMKELSAYEVFKVFKKYCK